jgi:hypothetical protein
MACECLEQPAMWPEVEWLLRAAMDRLDICSLTPPNDPYRACGDVYDPRAYIARTMLQEIALPEFHLIC